jgi:NAD(P)-dependent dehydrogenase (short-subunit alcohol dehydrogenase family)
VTALRSEGARVGIADLAEEVPTDVSDPEAVEAAVKRTVDEHGQLDLVFVNAGYLPVGRVEHLSVDDFDRALAVNLCGAFLVAKHAIPYLRAVGGGAIVLTGSTSSFVGAVGEAAYAASKAGVLNLARVLAAELASDSIRVNCVCPGWVDTAFNDPVWEFAGGREIAESRALAAVPLGRQARPEEIVAAMLFLASDEASYVTGSALLADGGMLGTA